MRGRAGRAGSCGGGGGGRFYALPDVRLRPGVGAYRGFRLTGERPQERLVVPSGRVSLLIGFGDEIRVGQAGRHPGKPVVHTSLVSGLHTRARVLGHAGRLHGIEVTLAPWAAHRMFGTPLGELADIVTDPGDVLGKRVEGLREVLATAPGWPERFELLDRTLLRWAADADPARRPEGSARGAWELLVRSSGTLSVQELAARSGWSVGHLETLFRREIGLTPKRAARILRLRRAIWLLTTGVKPVDTAIACGFYDQSHLSREFTALTGVTPGRFLAAKADTSVWLAG
ncbi:helix-turn-helix domain-containing protein [Streptomyces sp. NPDC050485]|uniref:helix-turn-helix domain-containing protein n=1 Tax=Streptomyces sp. NPDC050485 TaxID=3365617 RepID=UPI0037A9FDF4